MTSAPSIAGKMADALLRGFGVGLAMELSVRALVALGLLSFTFNGLLLVVAWCIYTNYFYYLYAGDRAPQNITAAVFLGLFFGAVSALALFVQGLSFKTVPLYVAGFSLLLSWATRLSVRRERARI